MFVGLTHCTNRLLCGLIIYIKFSHANWKKQNLLAIPESCHDYYHMSTHYKLRTSGAECSEVRVVSRTYALYKGVIV